MQKDSSENLKYIWLIVIQSILYGIMDVVSKQAYQIMSVYCFLFLRYVLAATIMLVLWRGQIFSELRKVSVSSYIVPGLCMSSAFIFSNLALRFTSATNMSFIRSLSALIAPLLAFVFFKQRYRKKDILLQLFMLVGYICSAQKEAWGILAREKCSLL